MWSGIAFKRLSEHEPEPTWNILATNVDMSEDATNVDIQTNWSCTWTWIILATIVETGEEKQIESSHAILTTSNVKMSKYEAEIGQVHGR